MKFEEAIVWYKHGHPIRILPQSKDISRYADYLTFTPTEQQFKVTQHQINSEDWEVKFYGGWIVTPQLSEVNNTSGNKGLPG
jgi:bifunctional ADP-heptose synthase (sugar kinase/adenylyltransferase)